MGLIITNTQFIIITKLAVSHEYISNVYIMIESLYKIETSQDSIKINTAKINAVILF